MSEDPVEFRNTLQLHSSVGITDIPSIGGTGLGGSKDTPSASASDGSKYLGRACKSHVHIHFGGSSRKPGLEGMT
eukprot:1139508-Pelagomonas_calceolata.AAC.7